MIIPITMPPTVAKVEIPKGANDSKDKLGCLLVGGMPCSGKTTHIEMMMDFGAIDRENTVIVSYLDIMSKYMKEEHGIDDISEAHKASKEYRSKIYELFHEAIIDAQKQKKEIVIDYYFLNKYARERIINLISDKYEIGIIFLITSMRVIKERNKQRGKEGGLKYGKKTLFGFENSLQYPVQGEHERLENIMMVLNEKNF